MGIWCENDIIVYVKQAAEIRKIFIARQQLPISSFQAIRFKISRLYLFIFSIKSLGTIRSNLTITAGIELPNNTWKAQRKKILAIIDTYVNRS